MPVICLNQWKASGPPLPAFTSPIAAYGVNSLSAAYAALAGQLANAGGGDGLLSSLVSPYPGDWTAFIAGSDPPPYTTSLWRDQNGNTNDLVGPGAGNPTLNYATHALDFNGTSTGLATAANVTLGGKFLTLYLRFKAGSLSETSILFETNDGNVANKGVVRLSMVAGVFTASVSDQTAVVALLNTRIKTISDTNWHVATLIVDSSLSAANQVKLLIDNSATGVTAPISIDLANENLTTAKWNVGARNNSASAWFTGSVSHLISFSVAHNLTLAGQWYAYIASLNYNASSALVAGAGTPAANETYHFTAMVNGYASYNSSGTDPGINAITFNGVNAWVIWQDSNVDGSYYTSAENPAFPWLVSSFDAGDVGVPPGPTVTEVPS